jgi:hypothetical protein
MVLRIEISDDTGDALFAAMRAGATELAGHLPGLAACSLRAGRTPSGETEVHIELLLPQRQLILNRCGALPAAVLREALAAARQSAGAHQQDGHGRAPHDVLGIAA